MLFRRRCGATANRLDASPPISSLGLGAKHLVYQWVVAARVSVDVLQPFSSNECNRDKHGVDEVACRFKIAGFRKFHGAEPSFFV